MPPLPSRLPAFQSNPLEGSFPLQTRARARCTSATSPPGHNYPGPGHPSESQLEHESKALLVLRCRSSKPLAMAISAWLRYRRAQPSGSFVPISAPHLLKSDGYHHIPYSHPPKSLQSLYLLIAFLPPRKMAILYIKPKAERPGTFTYASQYFQHSPTQSQLSSGSILSLSTTKRSNISTVPTSVLLSQPHLLPPELL
jgi:hypothetical protein